MGKISGPTPNNKLTDVNNAAYFGLLIIWDTMFIC
jgi:hypothetical protein